MAYARECGWRPEGDGGPSGSVVVEGKERESEDESYGMSEG